MKVEAELLGLKISVRKTKEIKVNKREKTTTLELTVNKLNLLTIFTS